MPSVVNLLHLKIIKFHLLKKYKNLNLHIKKIFFFFYLRLIFKCYKSGNLTIH